MKFNFKIQQYQTDAVNAVVQVFNGQGYQNSLRYVRDLGNTPTQAEMSYDTDSRYTSDDSAIDIGFKNEIISLTDNELLANIKKIQNLNNIKQSTELIKNLGRCSLDIEMETGTGKTYVYLKTMFEVNKHYGWSKFIVVVPSIAIREGVKKTFEITTDHFMEHYSQKARFFVYDSKNLNLLDSFAANSGINVMIINTQAFASSLKEDGKNKEARIIYSKRDEFASRRPIDVIAANNPIIILDEPQKMGGEVTQKALKNFNPLFSLNYSATHKKQNNLIYVLDALDAYNKRLVKKIEVKGFEVKNLRGTDSYLYLEQIVLSSKKPPLANIELEINHKNGIKREIRHFTEGDNLYSVSKQMQQYKGYTVSEINPLTGIVTFTNGVSIKIGEVIGDISEENMRRIQIRETILSHFDKEEKLFNMGVKSLSLFFIDEVAKYRQYDENNNEILGEYGQIFEQEYLTILQQYLDQSSKTPYQQYLKTKCNDASQVHKGYFSIDKKTGKSIDSQLKRGSESSDDISAYDLILKNKEQLLSFDEPTRFIFSHSALREGWDNPNVFQICTLKHSDNQTAKRQEVGRGLRLCVNQDGNRMDIESCGEQVHDINMLTVIASESYRNFVNDLQADIKTVIYDRPTVATSEYFFGKYVEVNGVSTIIDKAVADKIEFYLISHSYVDIERKITDKYRNDVVMNSVAPLPDELQPMGDGIHRLIQTIYNDSELDAMFTDGHETKIKDNPLNENFDKAEFQALWQQINQQYAYTVNFNSDELINKAIAHINDKLFVSQLQYITAVGQLKDQITTQSIYQNDAFKTQETKTTTLEHAYFKPIKYDLIGQIAQETTLTRKTVVAILKGLDSKKLDMFKDNPEEFIAKIIKLIKEQKATTIIEHITYNKTSGKYDSTIFTQEKSLQNYDKAFLAKKAIQDYVFTDGLAEKSIERRFVEDLDTAEEVCVYAKLPKGFHIPTPVGNYSPDWAIAFHVGKVKHIFFIAETKGTMDSLNLRPIEQAKISCAKKLFNELSTSKVRYHDVDSYQSLMNIMNSL
ncbi:type III restriction-modification system endonuclease [Gilliamella sp. Imp1-1]|uniref:type III restriction-modification system endonuclease n=1 Tax=Gilliamella sp. Imp1-1 TaxID=3120248 RepID=UPI0004614D9E|nr:DEAD/DEAH box helicase family protein [Gilliamella apicola]KDN11156.1 Type III restriction enzyme, res subunit:DEAD/DEAH box helicase, N-terminal [Gilliamella apicola]OCG51280.1 restriction endonuclease subunit R [Gilliamella apicola]